MKILILLISMTLISCSTIHSGKYVRLERESSAEEIAEFSGADLGDVYEMNRTKSYMAGDYIFIPEKRSEPVNIASKCVGIGCFFYKGY